MRKLFRKYRELPFEGKMVWETVLGLGFSAAFAAGKLIIGSFTDYNLCIIAVYTFALIFAKLECVLGIKFQKISFATRNLLIALFVLAASLVYIGYMSRLFFIERPRKDYEMVYVLLLAFISFVEFGFAVGGIVRTKNNGHFYRDVKIINFCIAIIAILTTQMTILDFTATENTDFYNAFSGVAIGVFIAICAVYILIAPKISVIDREHNVFILKEKEKNVLVNMKEPATEIPLCRSRIYGSFVYRATVREQAIDGHIMRDKNIWKRMNFILKVLCIILSEILIFVWLFGRLVFFFRTINLPRRLELKMKRNGFELMSESE